MEATGQHPAKSVTGALALAAWALYLVSAGIYYAPDYPASFWPLAGAGILAAAAVGAKFGRWRLVVILASCVYLAFYGVRVMRMVVLTQGFEISALPSALCSYFQSLWVMTNVMILEKGRVASLMHGYIEYAMPLLCLLLIALAWLSSRRAAEP